MIEKTTKSGNHTHFLTCYNARKLTTTTTTHLELMQLLILIYLTKTSKVIKSNERREKHLIHRSSWALIHEHGRFVSS